MNYIPPADEPCPDCGSTKHRSCRRSSDSLTDYADLLDAAMLLKRWTHKYPDTDLGLKTLDWLKRKNLRGSVLR